MMLDYFLSSLAPLSSSCTAAQMLVVAESKKTEMKCQLGKQERGQKLLY